MRSDYVNIKEVTTGYQARIKPNVFLLEGKRTFAKLKKNKVIDGCISEIVTGVFRPGIFKRIFVDSLDYGLPYLTAQAMMTEFPLSSSKILSKKLTNNLESMILDHKSILVSCAGTIGNIRLIDKNMADTVGSQDIIRVIPKQDFGFVYAYLTSKPVYSYLQSQLYGSVVPRIEPDIVSNIPLIAFRKETHDEIDSLVKQSLVLREEASDALEEAKLKLSNFIAIHFEKNNFKTGVVSSKSIWNSLQHRLDPPALMNDGVIAMRDVTMRLPYSTIGEINAVVRRPGIFKRNYVANGIPYIKGSEIFLNNPFRRCEHLSRTRTPFIDEMTLYEGLILITCAGSVGNIKMITKEYEDKKAIGSQDIIRLISTDNLYTREYLYTYLQIPFVYDYIQSMKYGSVIERIEPFHIESIPVVTPTRELSDEITSTINRYMNCSYRAFCAEEKAVQLIEQEIEKWNK
jgi:hypothetical protein